MFAVQPLLAKFQCVSEIEEVWAVLFPGQQRNTYQNSSVEDQLPTLGGLLKTWDERLQMAHRSWQVRLSPTEATRVSFNIIIFFPVPDSRHGTGDARRVAQGGCVP